jgi:subtilisin
MVKNKELEKILNYISNNYDVEEPNINPAFETINGLDETTGLKIYYDKTITDFYALDVEENSNNSKEIIKINFFDRMNYKFSNPSKKKKLIKKFNQKYIKPKENELKNLVTNEKISKIEKKTNEVFNKVNLISYQLDNAEILKNEQIIERRYENKNSQDSISKSLKLKQELINEYTKKNANRKLIISLKKIPTTDLKAYISEISNKISSNYPNTELQYLNNLPIMALTGSQKEIQNIARDLKNRRYRLNNLSSLDQNIIRYIEMDQIYFLPELGNEFKTIRLKNDDVLWNLKNIQADLAQEITKGNGIKIGIIDTGIDYNHKELINLFNKNNLGYNFIDQSNNPMDDHGHGTHVAGTVGGIKTGIATSCQLYALKVLNSQGYGSSYDVMSAVSWAIENNLDIINLSLGSNQYLNVEQELYNEAFNSGLLTVAAAGNSYDNSYSYPASYQNVISVAAVDRNNEHAEFSTHNDMVDIAAPGVSILSSIPGDKYATYSGTSMATPHIAGVSALIKSLEEFYPEELEEILNESSKYLGDKNYFGSGLVQANDALDFIEDYIIKNNRGIKK